MDVDVWVRRIALAAIPLLGVAIYFLRTDPEPEAPPDPAPSSAAHDGLPEPAAGPGARDLKARGEAALAEPRPSEPPPPAPTPTRTRSRAAADLPLAGDAPRGRSAEVAPRGPCGGIEARLITVTDDAEWTFASLAPPGEPAAIRHVGDRVGGWRVQKIEWDRVWLASGSGRCAVGIHVGAREGGDSVGGTPAEATPLDDAPARPPLWHVPRELANAIERVGDGSYAVERGIVKGLYERADELLSGTKLTPVKRDERVIGIELGEVRTDSLLDRFGVASGDIVLEINGEASVTLAATLAGFEKARKAERLDARLERTGRPYELVVVAR